MHQINIQQKAVIVEAILENKQNAEGKINTRLIIPLTPFISGVRFEAEPVVTEIIFDAIPLDLKALQGQDVHLSTVTMPDLVGSIFLGDYDNVVEATYLKFSKQSDQGVQLLGELVLNFEIAGIAKNEILAFAVPCRHFDELIL